MSISISLSFMPRRLDSKSGIRFGDIPIFQNASPTKLDNSPGSQTRAGYRTYCIYSSLQDTYMPLTNGITALWGEELGSQANSMCLLLKCQFIKEAFQKLCRNTKPSCVPCKQKTNIPQPLPNPTLLPLDPCGETLECQHQIFPALIHQGKQDWISLNWLTLFSTSIWSWHDRKNFLLLLKIKVGLGLETMLLSGSESKRIFFFLHICGTFESKDVQTEIRQESNVKKISEECLKEESFCYNGPLGSYWFIDAVIKQQKQPGYISTLVKYTA